MPSTRDPSQSTLMLDVHPGEALVLDGGRVVVEVLHKGGRVARLRVTAPRSTPIQKTSAAADHPAGRVPSMAI